jgi:hypothetical protein
MTLPMAIDGYKDDAEEAVGGLKQPRTIRIGIRI